MYTGKGWVTLLCIAESINRNGVPLLCIVESININGKLSTYNVNY